MVSTDSLYKEYASSDEFDVDKSVNDWLNNFTDVNLDEIYSHITGFSNYGYKQNTTCNSKYSFEFM